MRNSPPESLQLFISSRNNHFSSTRLISASKISSKIFLFLTGIQMSAMQIGGSQKMSQVDQGPVWTTDSKCDGFLKHFPLNHYHYHLLSSYSSYVTVIVKLCCHVQYDLCDWPQSATKLYILSNHDEHHLSSFKDLLGVRQVICCVQ